MPLKLRPPLERYTFLTWYPEYAYRLASILRNRGHNPELRIAVRWRSLVTLPVEAMPRSEWFEVLELTYEQLGLPDDDARFED